MVQKIGTYKCVWCDKNWGSRARDSEVTIDPIGGLADRSITLCAECIEKLRLGSNKEQVPVRKVCTIIGCDKESVWYVNDPQFKTVCGGAFVCDEHLSGMLTTMRFQSGEKWIQVRSVFNDDNL